LVTGITVLSVYGANFDPTNENKSKAYYTVVELNGNKETSPHRPKMVHSDIIA